MNNDWKPTEINEGQPVKPSGDNLPYPYTTQTLKIGTTGYKLNPEKLKDAPRQILPYLFSPFSFTESFEYFDLVKPYLDIPEPPKTLEEISQELDEKIDALIKTTKEKFECSKYFAEKRYKEKFDRIIGNFEYAREHGEFRPKLSLTYDGAGLGWSVASSSHINSNVSYVIKQGNNHKGYYTFGNQQTFKYYTPDKPNRLVRFFMKTCLSLVWVDE